MKAFLVNECDTVVTTDGIEEVKQWYTKEIEEVYSIEPIDPDVTTMLYAMDYGECKGITLLPPNETGVHQFTVVDGEVAERITIREAYERDGEHTYPYVIASKEY